MECSALGVSYVRWKPRNWQLAKMGTFHHSKWSDNEWYAVKVRWVIFIENLTDCFIPYAPIIGHPLGGITFLLFLWQGIHLKREKQKTNISQLSAIVISEEGNSGNNTMEMDLHYNTCAIRRGRHHKHEEKGGPLSSAQRSSCLFI